MKKLLLSTCICLSVMGSVCMASGPIGELQKSEENQNRAAIAVAVPQSGSVPLTPPMTQFNMLATSSPAPDPLAMADMLAELEDITQQAEPYDSATEYDIHKNVHERFFRHSTKNRTAKAAIKKFTTELAADPNRISRISLDGLSSRTRIMLMRELVLAAAGKNLSIQLSFHGKDFNLNLTPTPDQPGNGILTSIGSYKEDVFPVLTSYKEAYQAKYARKLSKARKVSATHTEGELDYHPAITGSELKEDGKRVDLEMLNLLLDFEISRRLIGSPNDFAKRFDSVPVGSAIVGLLQLPQKDKDDSTYVPLEKFFDGKDSQIAGKTFRNGKYNPFEGSAGNPTYSDNPAHRELATKKIIRKLRGGDSAQPSTKEGIHQDYLAYYGGASESDGDDYDKKVEADAAQDE